MICDRNSTEIMKEILSLLSQYNEVKEYEDQAQRDRLDYLETQLRNQEYRIIQAAQILLKGE